MSLDLSVKREATGFCYDFSDHWSPWSWMTSWQIAVLLQKTGIVLVSETQEDCIGHQTYLKYNSETTDLPGNREIVDRQELRKWEVLNFQHAGVIPGRKHRYPFLQSHRHQAKVWFYSEWSQWIFFLCIWIPQVNARFVLLLQAYSVFYLLFCLFFSIHFLFSI